MNSNLMRTVLTLFFSGYFIFIALVATVQLPRLADNFNISWRGVELVYVDKGNKTILAENDIILAIDGAPVIRGRPWGTPDRLDGYTVLVERNGSELVLEDVALFSRTYSNIIQGRLPLIMIGLILVITAIILILGSKISADSHVGRSRISVF